MKREPMAVGGWFVAWCALVVLVAGWAAVASWVPAMRVPAAWAIGGGLVLLVAPLWLEPWRVARWPGRLKQNGAWRYSPRRYARRTLILLSALVPAAALALVVLELGYGIWAAPRRRVSPEGLRFLVAAAALVPVPGAVMVSQATRRRFRREVARLGDCFECGYELRGVMRLGCPECGESIPDS